MHAQPCTHSHLATASQLRVTPQHRVLINGFGKGIASFTLHESCTKSVLKSTSPDPQPVLCLGDTVTQWPPQPVPLPWELTSQGRGPRQVVRAPLFPHLTSS